ncbi:SDR family oxidoreductase [Methylovirgula sp. 4M-Z18]|uniref:SDR family oxidoreductase n=1 Tax=Methylovirgula sp. 4M-Z18 TaxID=2293567 RepID=UPI000E2F0926|nr:SDR family oxidoreductase [Methylovirgula sp. 4M-Z18]RFB80796.1 SDR family oxidoreductase [Methylovirgula sp. 4M-Z18]
MSKTIIITGGGRGIGRACAVLAAKRGWSVAFNYRSNKPAADALVAEIEALGGKAIGIQGDVSNEAETQALFAVARAAFGAIDGVIINAGIVAPGAQVADMSFERLQTMININVLGALLTAREAARALSTKRNGKGGAIVVMSSAAARLGSPGEYVDYAATKGAMDTMTIGLAKELGPEGVRVNAIRPGLIDTEIHASGGQPDRAFALGPTVPLGRPGQAEEVAAAAIWLLSDDASYVTGAVLDVTGGR